MYSKSRTTFSIENWHYTCKVDFESQINTFVFFSKDRWLDRCTLITISNWRMTISVKNYFVKYVYKLNLRLALNIHWFGGLVLSTLSFTPHVPTFSWSHFCGRVHFAWVSEPTANDNKGKCHVELTRKIDWSCRDWFFSPLFSRKGAPAFFETHHWVELN